MKLESVSSKIEIDYELNVLAIGPLFKSKEKHLLVGTTDGTIKVYLHNKLVEVLETKGSSILTLELCDSTNFGDIDIISGDSHGNVVIFSNHQILYRDTINGPISSIITHVTSNNDFNIVVGDRLGQVTSIKPHQNVQWKFKVPTLSQTLDTLKMSQLKENESLGICMVITEQKSQTVKDMVSIVNSVDQFDNSFNYIIISENHNVIHLIDQGRKLASISPPSPVNTMCKGYFDSRYKNSIQVLLGCENGFIYILHDFKLDVYCQVGYPITILKTLSLTKPNKNTTTPTLDHVICTGDFNSLKIYSNRNLICDHILEDWVSTLAIGDIENSGESLIVIGKLNNTIEFLKPVEY
ncbi:hypothetical protein DLAC_03644 [Tieghemostelium lacteum]|uniref:WD40 repeat-containing protein n=1 Tax=Tieghemostelium lacteum TaxID=361077 RepID=A0A152A0H6_TIELA|nr:hypothetical protein DLAC_03644 [Tieghemostelium lacteum]|eukprot:KYQ99703.1 hypothetical protein DLAC_03644 [Tieghemostelium lacteum]